MATGSGGSNPFTIFFESPGDAPSPKPPRGPGSGGVPPLSPSAYDSYPVQEVAYTEKPQPVADRTDPAGQPLEPSPFFSNVPPDPMRISQACVATRREEERERLPTRQGGDQAYDRYHGRYDFDEKEGWQSQKVSPKLAISVERLVAALARIREKTTNWFDIEPIDDTVLVYYSFVKTLMKHFLDHPEVDFDGIFRDAVKTGLLQQMMYVLVAWESEGHVDIEPAGDGLAGQFSAFSLPDDPLSEAVDQSDFGASSVAPVEDDSTPMLPGTKQPKLRVEVLNPDYVYKDSSGRNRYIIWELRYSKGEALREGKIRGWDVEALERALANPITSDDTTDTLAGFHESRDAAKQDKVPDYKAYAKCKVTNYFGDLYDPNTGDLLLEDHYFIMVNDKEIVYGPIPNPFWDGRCPVVDAPIIKVPFAAYGRSPIVWNLDMYDLWNEYLNLLVDYMQSVLLGMKEIDLDLVEDYDDNFRDGIFPGKMIPTSKGGQNVQAIMNVPFSDVPQGFWQHMQILQQELSDNVLLSDTIGGQTRTRGRITAMEFNRRAADAGSMIDFIFNGIEKKFMAPTLERIFYRFLQFMGKKQWAEWIETHKKVIQPKDPELMAQWEAVFEDMKSWTPQQRFKKLGGFFKFKVNTFSALGDNQMEIEKGTFFMQTASQIPGAAQYIRWDKLMRHIVRAFGWDPEEILSPEALPLPMAAAQIGNTQLMQQLMQQQGGDLEEGPSLGAPKSISTSPPFAPGSQGAPGPGSPPQTGATGPGVFG